LTASSAWDVLPHCHQLTHHHPQQIVALLRIPLRCDRTSASLIQSVSLLTDQIMVCAQHGNE
jgi:hypothetical protein